MKSICILYATREGQTQRIAEHVAAELRVRGFTVAVTNVRDHAAQSSLNTCTAAILAASVHAGRHEPEMLQFVKEHRGKLECLPTAFLSVTLSEALVVSTRRGILTRCNPSWSAVAAARDADARAL